MKIVFLSRYQNTTERGAEVFVKELTTRLSKNHTVDIFSGNRADSLSDVLKGKYDVVIPINGRWQAINMSMGRLIGGYKILITGHSGKGWDDILNISLAKPDVFVALSDYLTNWAKKWAWGSRVIKINNGIDVHKFSPTGEKLEIDLPRPIILSVGALVWYKHHKKVIEAASKIETGSVLIIGEGPLKNELKSLGDKLLKGRFSIKSFRNEEMPKVYRSCDLFTLPSWDREAFGIVYLEAMASGLGVVAPADLSRKEIVGDAGILCDTKDNSIYADSLKSALNINWKFKARKQAEKFSWEKVADQYEKLLMDLR